MTDDTSQLHKVAVIPDPMPHLVIRVWVDPFILLSFFLFFFFSFFVYTVHRRAGLGRPQAWRAGPAWPSGGLSGRAGLD